MTKLLEIDGKRVVDAKRRAVLTITPDDVKAGRKKKPDCCAAAQACMRQFGAKQARVHLSRVYVETPKEWVRYNTPASLRTEIISFDRGHRFTAGEYELGRIATYNSSKARRNPKTTSADRKTGTHPQKSKRSKPWVVQGVRYSAGMAGMLG